MAQTSSEIEKVSARFEAVEIEFSLAASGAAGREDDSGIQRGDRSFLRPCCVVVNRYRVVGDRGREVLSARRSGPD